MQFQMLGGEEWASPDFIDTQRLWFRSAFEHLGTEAADMSVTTPSD